MLLEDKNAVIYGAGGKVGGAVARAFAREGARVFLAGRTMEKIDAVAEEVSVAGGAAETAQVDALDEQAVKGHLGEVVEKAGGHRCLLQRHLDSPRGSVDIARRDVARRFHEPDHDRRVDTLPDGGGGGAAHGQTRLRCNLDALHFGGPPVRP
jgi:NAD(P)-dependent dehydrogenase (short-subunit alcohol dehydrogenase family)